MPLKRVLLCVDDFIAKPFSRSVRVTFDAPLINRGDKGPPMRPYPNAPDGLTLRYRPIGSGTGTYLCIL